MSCFPAHGSSRKEGMCSRVEQPESVSRIFSAAHLHRMQEDKEGHESETFWYLK